MLRRRTGPLPQDEEPEVLKIQSAFPRRAQSLPMRAVENRNNTTTTVDELAARDLVDHEAFRWRGDVVCGDVVEGELDVKGVEDVLGEAGRKVLGQVVDVVGLLARFASSDRDTAVTVSSRHAGGEIEVKELVVKRSTVGDVRRWCGAGGEDLEWAGPVKRQFGLYDKGVGALLGTLADS